MTYIILIVALLGIVFGADALVNGSVTIARRFKVSDFVIGAAIVGVGTSMPELLVSTIGAIGGNSEVAIGNVVGSNIFNILGILGITTLISPVKVSRDNKRFELPFCILVSTLLVLLVYNFFIGGVARIGRFDGLILLAFFCVSMWYSFYRDRKKPVEKDVKVLEIEVVTPLWGSILKVVVGLALLVISCDTFVDHAVALARKLGASDALISVTLIACGTSLPELAASVAAAIRKNTQLALGNIIGSNIFNITLILGISSQIIPLETGGISVIDYGTMCFAAVLTAILVHKDRIPRWGGLVMLICFIVYNIVIMS
jgi:cation:H+ antiporter